MFSFTTLTSCAEWAVEGFTEAVAKEVKPEWGIKFTIIEPGAFRTVSFLPVPLRPTFHLLIRHNSISRTGQAAPSTSAPTPRKHPSTPTSTRAK